jgi:hypothetical protein
MVVVVNKSNPQVVELPASSLAEPLIAKASLGRVRFEVQTTSGLAAGPWSSPIAAGWLDVGVERLIPLALEESVRIVRIVLTAVHKSASVALNLELDKP